MDENLHGTGRGHVSVSPGFEQGRKKGKGRFTETRASACSAVAQGTHGVGGPQPTPARARVCWQAGASAALRRALTRGRGSCRSL